MSFGLIFFLFEKSLVLLTESTMCREIVLLLAEWLVECAFYATYRCVVRIKYKKYFQKQWKFLGHTFKILLLIVQKPRVCVLLGDIATEKKGLNGAKHWQYMLHIFCLDWDNMMKVRCPCKGTFCLFIFWDFCFFQILDLFGHRSRA